MHSLVTHAAGAMLALVVALAPSAGHAQEPAPPDAAQIAVDEAARQAALAASGPRFDPATGRCVGLPPESEQVQATLPPGYRPDPTMNGGPGWQVSAPRGWPGPTHAGETVKLSLRDKFGTQPRFVYAQVFAPGGATARDGALLTDDGSGYVTYPSSFRQGSPTIPGTYTVVWHDTNTDGFIACDGFVVVP